uniref:DUF8018 domain-containing protein n=1 Tax=Ammopiptanthus mongolicus TaxID=126911 RepID=A0A4P8PG47_AMMMO|nr:hypothetical protein [Ammopiptanthus mongolicus]
MASSGAENSVSSWRQYLNSSSNTEGESAHEPSTSPSWTDLLSPSTERAGTSENQTAAGPVPPANPVAPGEADILPVVPYPYQEDEMIGGDSVLSIRRRLLASNAQPSAEDINLAHLDAQDRFEVKVDIIQQMAVLDPSGDWTGRGARALDNPRAASSEGEPSLRELYRLRDELHEGGVQSIRCL